MRPMAGKSLLGFSFIQWIFPVSFQRLIIHQEVLFFSFEVYAFRKFTLLWTFMFVLGFPPTSTRPIETP